MWIRFTVRYFPGDASGKKPSCHAGNRRDAGLIPGPVRKIPWTRGMAIHFSILAWRIPWTEDPGGLQSIGLQRVGHDWNNLTRMYTPYRYHYFSLRGGFWSEEPILQSKGGDLFNSPINKYSLNPTQLLVVYICLGSSVVRDRRRRETGFCHSLDLL